MRCVLKSINYRKAANRLWEWPPSSSVQRAIRLQIECRILFHFGLLVFVTTKHEWVPGGRKTFTTPHLIPFSLHITALFSHLCLCESSPPPSQLVPGAKRLQFGLQHVRVLSFEAQLLLLLCFPRLGSVPVGFDRLVVPHHRCLRVADVAWVSRVMSGIHEEWFGRKGTQIPLLKGFHVLWTDERKQRGCDQINKSLRRRGSPEEPRLLLTSDACCTWQGGTRPQEASCSEARPWGASGLLVTTRGSRASNRNSPPSPDCGCWARTSPGGPSASASCRCICPGQKNSVRETLLILLVLSIITPTPL